MALYESGENYLETILILGERLETVRSIDVANELGFSRPSVSRAMHILEGEGLLVMAENGVLTLTEEGAKRASAVYEKHKVIADFLSGHLGVNRDVALADACRIEHILSEETFERIKDKVSGNK